MAEKRQAQGRGKKAIIPDFTVSEFNGNNTYIRDIKELRDGESPDSLNWLTGQFKDHIELRRGYALLGTNRITGSGRVTGLGVGQLRNGTQIPYYTYGQKILYWNGTAFAECSISNALGAAANGEDVAVMPYQNAAGSFVYFTSPNSSIYRASPASPSNVQNLYTKNKGLGKIDSNRMFMWQWKDTYGNAHMTNPYLSVVDKINASSYSVFNAQNGGYVAVGTGNGALKTFTQNLSIPVASTSAAGRNILDAIFQVEVAAPIAAGQSITGITVAVTTITLATITMASTTGFTIGGFVTIEGVSGMTQINGLIGVVVAITTNTSIVVQIQGSTFSGYSSGGTVYPAEYFIDDQNGNLNSNLGGTGTVGYLTGAITLNFNTAPINNGIIEIQYLYEDPTSGGIADFSQDQSTAGKGKEYPQFDGGGNLQVIWPFDQLQYCFHILKTWYVSCSSTDVLSAGALNLPYRSSFGIPYWRSAYPTPDGILILDNSHPAEPKVRFMEISPAVAALITVVPTSISDQLDLSPYGFGLCVSRRWGDYDLIAFENVTNGIVDSVNTRMFVRNIFSGQWDLIDYAVSCLDEFNGALIAGDALSNNVFTLFSGTDDDGALINNHWTSKQYLFAEGLKKLNRFVIKGLIQSNQNIDIYFSFDNGAFIKLFTVNGNGAYVNTGAPNIVGADTLGSQVVGGGSGEGPQIVAYPYEVEFIVGSDKFEYVQVQFQANNIGYCSIDQYTFKDIRWCGRRSAPSRMATF